MKSGVPLPAGFIRGLQKRPYFEGWYYKNVSSTGDVVACIPGVSFQEQGDNHGFIQLINGWNSRTDFFRYPIDECMFSDRDLDLRIGTSHFTENEMHLHIEQDGRSVRGDITFREKVRLQTSFLSPGIMGWYTFAPFMECYHGVVSLDHRLSGSLAIDDRSIDFAGGRGYIEKDWGTSFPSSWIWLQSNNFSSEGSSFMLSVARIPWIKSSFTGFLCVVYTRGREYRFATYTGAKIEDLHVEGGNARVRISDGRYQLTVRAEQGAPAGLKAPVNGGMDRIISESITSKMHVNLKTTGGRLIIDEVGEHAGMEIAGNMEELIPT